MATKELNDLTGEFTGKVGNLEDYSREFLLRLARVYEETWFYGFHAFATAYAKKVGEAEAWDTACEISRGIGRQIMPISLRVASKGPSWGDAGLVAQPFDCTVDLLTKEGLIQLCQAYQDRWLKQGNHWLDAVMKKAGMEAIEPVFLEAYQRVGDYEIPKIAKAGNLEPKTVVDAIKVANMTIDASKSFGGDFEVTDPDHVVLKMTRCKIIDEYVKQGVYGPPGNIDTQKVYEFNCKAEAKGSMMFMPGVQVDVELTSKEMDFKPGQPYCIWTYTKKKA